MNSTRARKKQKREIRLRATVFYSDLRGDCQAEPELAEAVPKRFKKPASDMPGAGGKPNTPAAHSHEVLTAGARSVARGPSATVVSGYSRVVVAHRPPGCPPRAGDSRQVCFGSFRMHGRRANACDPFTWPFPNSCMRWWVPTDATQLVHHSPVHRTRSTPPHVVRRTYVVVAFFGLASKPFFSLRKARGIWFFKA